MRAYSSEELDVMADAYGLALEALEGASASPELAQLLVDAIGAGVTHGLRDERALAKAALKKARASAIKLSAPMPARRPALPAESAAWTAF